MSFLVGITVIVLYFWAYFNTSPEIESSLIVNTLSVALAGVTVLISFISYLWAPEKIIFPIALTIYLSLTATAASLIVSTGNALSPFVALWMLLSIFASVFGLWGSLTILITTCVFIAGQYINGNFTIGMMVTVTLGSLLPLIAGIIIWHNKSGNDESNGNNRAYRTLADKLSEVASKSEVVINAIGDGVMVIDNKSIIQLINPAAQRLIGWGKQDALTLNYKSVLRLVNQKNETLDTVSDPIQQVLNTNQQIRTNDLALMTNSGKKLMISLVVSPVGEMGSGIIAVFHDITKEKSDEREQAEFISTASHEMRTPVASIEGYLGLTLSPQTAQIDERARDFIMKAHASAEHLGHLFQDLLDVSKADDGRMPNNPKVVNVVMFTHEIVQGLAPRAAAKKLQLIFKPLPEGTSERIIPPVYSVNLDNDHLREIINNLVENAIKYTPTGVISVDITGDEDHVTIIVKDTGIGIPAEDMPHLFQKFYRVDNRDTREIGGTGLGLYLSRRLAEIMGGRIWAESVYTKGSTFFVELPRISNQEVNRIVEQETLVAQEEISQKSTIQAKPMAPTITTFPKHFKPAPTITSSVQPTPIVNQQVVPIPQSAPVQQQTTPPVNTTTQPISQPGIRPQSISVPIRRQQ